MRPVTTGTPCPFTPADTARGYRAPISPGSAGYVRVHRALGVGDIGHASRRLRLCQRACALWRTAAALGGASVPLTAAPRGFPSTTPGLRCVPSDATRVRRSEHGPQTHT